MYKKIFISIIAMAISIISGVRGFQYVKDNSVEEGVVNNKVTQDNIIDNTTIGKVEETEERQENILNEKEEQVIDNNLDAVKNSNSTIVSKETKAIEKQKTAGQKDNNKTEAKKSIETKDTTIKTAQEDTKKVESQKVEQKPKEEYIYNDTATKKLINDINTIAKRNPDLWGANGEKLYNIKTSKNLIGKNYMSPYSYGQVEGKVLNVYSVTFLVYAVDYKKTGLATETRYYIDITNFQK